MGKIVAVVAGVSLAVILGARLEVSQSLAAETTDLPLPVLAENSQTASTLEGTVVASTTEVDAATTLSTANPTTNAPQAVPQAATTIKKTATAAVAPKKAVTATEETTSPKTATLGTADQYPVRLIIPSIGLDAPIVPVGVNAKGEMDVPNGSTNQIGWYKKGTMPGDMGSAVLDAHVFAALKDLKYVKLGSPVYVETKGGTRLKFVLKESMLYTLSQLTSDMLFGRNDARRLNIITCAGTYVPSLRTYDHRLVDYAIFEGEEL